MMVQFDLTRFNGQRKMHLNIYTSYKFKGKKVILFVFALSVIAGPSLAWGWGEGGCSYSKDKTNQKTKTEQVKETDA